MINLTEDAVQTDATTLIKTLENAYTQAETPEAKLQAARIVYASFAKAIIDEYTQFMSDLQETFKNPMTNENLTENTLKNNMEDIRKNTFNNQILALTNQLNNTNEAATSITSTSNTAPPQQSYARMTWGYITWPITKIAAPFTKIAAPFYTNNTNNAPVNKCIEQTQLDELKSLRESASNLITLIQLDVFMINGLISTEKQEDHRWKITRQIDNLGLYGIGFFMVAEAFTYLLKPNVTSKAFQYASACIAILFVAYVIQYYLRASNRDMTLLTTIESSDKHQNIRTAISEFNQKFTKIAFEKDKKFTETEKAVSEKHGFKDAIKISP